MPRKRYALLTLALAGIAGVAWVYRPKQTQPKPCQRGPRGPRGQVAVVVTALDNHQNLLDSDPALVLVGTRGTQLKQRVALRDAHRVIETETDAGWTHIVKHLRPDVLVLSHGLDASAVANFTRQVMSMEDFIGIN